MSFRIDTLGKKIGFGYVLMALVLAISVIITIRQVSDVNTTSDRLIELRQPSARADLELLNGINRSIAEVRGWVLLKKDTFKVGRRDAWKYEVRPALSKLESMAEDWTNPTNTERLAMLAPMIDRMEQYQEQVEDVALNNTDSAVALMDEKMLPLNKEIREIVRTLVEDHERLMLEDYASISSQISLLSNIEWILLAVGLLISFLLAFIITRSITVPVAGAVEVARNIGSGNLDTRVDVGGSTELVNLGNALVEMRDSLVRKTEETQRYDWLNTGQNKLNEAMRGDKEMEELANEIITFMGEYTGASIGAVYLTNDAGTELTLAGSYAFTSEQAQGTFKMGEGLIGQAAASNQSLGLGELDEKDIRVKSSVVDTPPRNVFVIPFRFEERTLGVVELGKFDAFTETHREFIEVNMELVGIALNSAIARRKIRELLEETQKQSEELQQQQEELEQTNEELEEQTQKLKEQQEELQASNEELEEQTQVVEQKNKDLEAARTDIELKAKQLEISSKYKSEFLANMSHELRTPLNSLLILSNDLAHNKAGNLDEEQVESAEVIAKSGTDLLNLINEILDLSKIEAGKMDLNLKNTDVEDIMQDLQRNFRRTAEGKGLELKTNIDHALPTSIRTDRQRLEQVLKNLISNAIKFTDKGSVTISFNREAGDYLAIAVKDTGIGIPKDKQQVVFEAFQQADGGTSRKYGGTGLGLSISRELAKLLGGRITLESVVGKGSTFTLVIPLQTGDIENVPPAPKEKASKPTTVPAGSQFVNYPTIDDQREQLTGDDVTILIIEDDSNFARVLGAQANEKGFKYISAATGEDGLLLAAQYNPKAILLDIDLPGIDGHMVLKELKGNPDLRHIPVHIMSVNEKTLDPIRSGAVEYLTKPVTKEQLNDAFGRIEDFVSRKMKNLLVVEDDDILRKSMVKLIGNGDVKCYEAATGKEALKHFKEQSIDCMVLDIGLPDMNGFELIKKLEEQLKGKVPPIIVYTGRELSKQENEELQQYAETIIVKGVKSEERLLDETALFLHRAVRNLPTQKQDMITGLYDKETMFQGKKVLLVDDDMRNIFALGKVLSEKGLKIIKAENGKVALKALKNDPEIDLVLMDIMMPEMDGYECMQEIRKQKEYKNLSIIALTAKAMKEDRQKCIDAGANDYIAKPVDVERLLSLMRIWIRK